MPLALKENIDTADFPTTAGTPALAGASPETQRADRAALARCRRHRADTGLNFVSLMAQVKSPSVKRALARLRGADAVSEATYREALTKHRPALQETYRRYFRERGVAAMVFPTTPLPAAKIGEDDTVMLNGAPVSTLSTFIRNLAPGSAAGIPGLSLPAGMTKAGLPVGLAIDAPEKSDHQLLAIGLALETVLPALPAPSA
jgi:Asp-tRNA(Asn)/Glu-tRNA(Gln) amidotransferase A subunit family amidase